MEKRVVIDKKNKIAITGYFDKSFKNDEYELLFNTKTGFEILRGINNNSDPFKTELPTLIDVGIMGHCENHCPFCYQGNKHEENMTLDNFKYLIDNIKHHTNQVALGGRGNPEDHEDFEEIVKYARKNNVIPNYTTAGNHVNKRIVDISKEYCGSVAVSAYDMNFTYNALKMFMEGGCKTNIHFIYSKESHEKVIDLLNGKDIWKGKIHFEKLNAIVFLLFKAKGNGKNITNWNPSKEQFKELALNATNEYSLFKVGFDSCAINKIKEYANFSTIQKMSIDTCESGRMSTYITPDMKLVPCSFADHDKFGVPILKEGIEKAWNSKPFEMFREVLKKYPDSCPALTL